MHEILEGGDRLNNCYYLFTANVAMSTAASSRHISWSFKLDTSIIVNVFDALDAILRANYRLKFFK